jgi:two-component system, LytTR family, response regulator
LGTPNLQQILQMRVLIVDDERKARERLAEMLKQIPEVSICGEAIDGASALEAIEREKPDVVLLDIQMPRLNGFEILDELSGQAIPLIIFVTGYNQYAIKAFEVSAVDYLLKPFTIDRLRQALAKASKIMALDKSRMGELAIQEIGRLMEALGQAQSSRIPRIVGRHGSKLQILDVSSIQAFLSDGAVVVRAITDQGTFSINRSLKDLEDRLDPNHFARIHRQILVNLSHLIEIIPRPQGGASAKLACGQELEISRRYISPLKAKLNW